MDRRRTRAACTGRARVHERRAHSASLLTPPPHLNPVKHTWAMLYKSAWFCVDQHQLYFVPSRVWTVPSLSAWKCWKIRDDFDPDWQLELMGPPARSNPTARRGWNHLEFFKIFMQTGTELSTLSMGQSIRRLKHTRLCVRNCNL